MSEAKAKTYEDFELPPTVVSKVDVSRLVSELERVDNQLTSAAVRSKVAEGEQPAPVMSEQLTDFLGRNKLSVDDSHGRSELIKQVRLLKEKAPIIHMTFAVATDPESLGTIAEWLRKSVHPQAVIAVGLQPSLVAGVYMRTPNHIHDLSLKAKLEASHDVLVKELETLRGK